MISPAPIVLRNLGVVDGLPFACGMKRQVYNGRGRTTGLRCTHQCLPAGQNAGFEAIAGFSSEEIYAVGWKGEIWEWNRAQSLKRESPTNLILTGVCCGDDGHVYVCGQHGTLLRRPP